MSAILVIAEQRDGKLNRASWESIAAAQSVGARVQVVVAGADVSAVAAELAAADVAGVTALQNPALEPYTPDGFLQAFVAFIQSVSPDLVLLPHTYQARDFAPALAARLDRAFITDCIAVASKDGRVVSTRPVFQAKLTADVVGDGPTPNIATIQIGA